MNVFYWISGCILAFAWFSRIVDAALGMPSLAEVTRPQWDIAPPGNPRVSVIVPARNEEGDIEPSLLSLLELDYENYEVIVVNDRSLDRTGELIDRVAALAGARGRLTAIHIESLPEGWLGKPHAMWSAARKATGDWLLFTDADVKFRADSVRRVLAYACKERADHVVLFPSMVMQGPGEKMMIAFFQTLFVFGHRPWKVADPKAPDHIGVGAFNLVRKPVYEAVGTYQALRMEVLDDMKLGKVVKNAGFVQRNVFGRDLISIRWAKGTFGVVRNLSKNFFAVLSFQWPRAVASVVGAAFLNLLPFVGIFLAQGWAKLPYAVALASMLAIYVGMSSKSSIPPYYFLLHPVSTVLFLYTILLSMTQALSNRGITWRGTFYPLEELRKGRV